MKKILKEDLKRIDQKNLEILQDVLEVDSLIK